jgi:hypothetical protein
VPRRTPDDPAQVKLYQVRLIRSHPRREKPPSPNSLPKGERAFRAHPVFEERGLFNLEKAVKAASPLKCLTEQLAKPLKAFTH